MLPKGYVIKDTYVVERFIARGGMSFIYQVWHKGLECSLALKVLSPEWATEEEFMRRFRDEARSMAQLHHPNVTQVIDFDTIPGGAPYLVMELVQGEDLAKFLQSRGPQSMQVVLLICRQVAEALAATHEKGIVHRDLKPGNIVLTRHSSNPFFVKLLDFGIAKMPSSQNRTPTVAGTLLGTPEYMSPEQADGKDVDHRTDQYALAVIVYEMLSGSRPFQRTEAESNDVSGLLKRIKTEPPPPLTGASPGVELVVRRAMSKSPEDRYPSIMEFMDALSAAAEVEPPPTEHKPPLGPKPPRTEPPGPKPTTPEPPASDARRSGRWKWIIAAAGLLLTGLLITGLVLFVKGSAKDQRQRLPAAQADLGAPPDAASAAPAVAPRRIEPPPLPPEMVVFDSGQIQLGRGTSLTHPEGPAHLASIERFALGRFEVSMGEFRSYAVQVSFQGSLPWDGVEDFDAISNLPVNLVSRDQAESYCRWKYGPWQGRLPTEAEWEFAARDGQSARFFPWQANRMLPELVNAGRRQPTLMPVDSLPGGATQQGLLHMLGNVAEWTQSPAEPYPGSRARLPVGWVIRGGGADVSLRTLTATLRASLPPQRRDPFVGFRCAAQPPP